MNLDPVCYFLNLSSMNRKTRPYAYEACAGVKSPWPASIFTSSFGAPTRSSTRCRPKISDRWRERVWLQVECGNHRKLEGGAASGSLHRLVRLLVLSNNLVVRRNNRSFIGLKPAAL